MNTTATTAQRAALTRMGIDTPTDLTIREASDAIDAGRHGERPAIARYALIKLGGKGRSDTPTATHGSDEEAIAAMTDRARQMLATCDEMIVLWTAGRKVALFMDTAYLAGSTLRAYEARA